MHLRLTVEYDGTPFRGWAAQPGLPTVEAALREALSETFSSVEALVGARGEMTGPGWASVGGELWRARSETPLEAGERVRVRSVDGLTLVVEPDET